MNDEEKWNSGNAPQNDRDTGRFNEPPRYEHYNMHQTYMNETGQESEKKKRRKKSGGRKLASTISLAVVFGLVAGVVFQGVNFLQLSIWAQRQLMQNSRLRQRSLP